MKKMKAILVITLCLLTVAVLSGFAFADTKPQPAMKPHPIQGTVTSVESNSFVMTAQQSQFSVLTDSQTTIEIAPGVTVKFNAIKPGVKVSVEGSVSGNVINATRVHLELSYLNGTVKERQVQNLIINVQGGTKTLVLTSDTFFRSGQQSVTSADLTPGREVHCLGTRNNNTFTAWLVDLPLPHTDGVITALNGNLITVSTTAGSRQVVYNSQTVFRGLTAAGMKTGERIHAEGQMADNQLTARVISGPPHPKKKKHASVIHGTIASVGSNSITVHTPAGEQSYSTVNCTVYRGHQQLSISALSTGMEVEVMPQVNAFPPKARRINIVPPHLDGTITAVGNGDLTINTAGGTKKIIINENTQVDRGPGQNLNVSDLAEGWVVHVEGSFDGENMVAGHIHVKPL